jgi:hypothetical protein
MTAQDLRIITSNCKIHGPELLPRFLYVYQFGYKQAIIDQIKKEIKEMQA